MASLQFRTGAFSTGNTIQPVALRFVIKILQSQCFFCESARITRFPNWVDTLTWARFQSRSPKLLFLQTLLTPVRIMLLQIFYFSSQCAGDICFHRILACCQSNRGGACRSENVFKSSEFPPLSLLPLLPIQDLLEHLWFPSVVRKLFFRSARTSQNTADFRCCCCCPVVRKVFRL